MLWGIARSHESRREYNQDRSTGASVFVWGTFVRCFRLMQSHDTSALSWQGRSHPLLELMSLFKPLFDFVIGTR